MSLEADWKEDHRQRSARLWNSGKRSKPIVLPPAPIEIPEIRATDPPITDEDVQALWEEQSLDEIVWTQGVKTILLRYGENMRRLNSHQRDKNVVECRLMVAKYLRWRGWSYPRIGKIMNRDHSSIVHLLEPQRKRERYLKGQNDRAMQRYHAKSAFALQQALAKDE